MQPAWHGGMQALLQRVCMLLVCAVPGLRTQSFDMLNLLYVMDMQGRHSSGTRAHSRRRVCYRC